MKSIRSFLTRMMVMALTVSMLLSSAALAETITLKVDDGALVIGESLISLAEGTAEEKPVRISKDETGIVLLVKTTIGEIRISLGDADIRFDESILEYIELEEEGAAQAEAPRVEAPQPEPQKPETVQPAKVEELCPICGKPLSTGDHSQLDCGHYRCAVTGEHPVICTYCRRYTCNNQDHSATCTICGNHVCTKAHRENCAAPAAFGNYVGQTGGSYTYSTKTNSSTAYGLGSQERRDLLAQIEKLLNRIQTLSAIERRTVSEQAELEKAEKDLAAAYEKLAATN